MIADAGYHNGTWDVTPPDVFDGTEEEVYTFTFEKAPIAPPTGDDTNIALWGMLFLLSSFGLIALILSERKRKTN